MGPLAGLKVIEMVGLGPGPFCGMLLADMGAEVLRVDRVRAEDDGTSTFCHDRGKRSIGLDLKKPEGVEALLRLVERADGFYEVWRPGVAERLGVGPAECHVRNPRLIYGRLTSYGQEGPWSGAAGHDIDYLALAGALEPLGRAGQPPTPPINVIGDFAGGGMLLAFGIACAAYERERTGEGQVIDAAMIDGAALMLAPFYAGRASGGWGPRGTNMLDTAAPFHEVYETADGKWMAVGAIEPQFYAELLAGLGLAGEVDPAAQHDRAEWPTLKKRFATLFATKTRAQWSEIFDGRDACVAPALDPVEAAEHPHIAARGTLVAPGGVPQPAPAPRFSRTPAEISGPPTAAGGDTNGALSAWGFDADDIDRLRRAHAIA
ncbi:MAG: CaiB/BaiF CoA transferase family protein [Acidimicrobiia bacterium]